MILFYYMCFFFSFYYTILVLFIPLGPLPLGLLVTYFLTYFNFAFNDVLGRSFGTYVGCAIVIILVLLKYGIYRFSKNIYFLGYRLSRIILLILTIELSELLLFYYSYYNGAYYVLYKNLVNTILVSLFWLLAPTIIVDLVILSFIKYREAVLNPSPSSSKYLLVIPIFWLLVLWVPIILEPKQVLVSFENTNDVLSIIRVIIWVIVTVSELSMHFLLYKKKSIVSSNLYEEI